MFHAAQGLAGVLGPENLNVRLFNDSRTFTDSISVFWSINSKRVEMMIKLILILYIYAVENTKQLNDIVIN